MELRELPAQVAELTSEILQVRQEIRASNDRVVETLREEIRASNDRVVETLREEIRAGDEETRTVLREEIRESRTFMRVLHEDVIGRLATLQEHNAAQAKSSAKPTRKKATRKR